ncbi:hypothetical protein CSOJ01_16125, partial [Colletotrichum sojae]
MQSLLPLACPRARPACSVRGVPPSPAAISPIHPTPVAAHQRPTEHVEIFEGYDIEVDELKARCHTLERQVPDVCVEMKDLKDQWLEELREESNEKGSESTEENTRAPTQPRPKPVPRGELLQRDVQAVEALSAIHDRSAFEARASKA